VILVLNSGSSSVKYRTIDLSTGQGERGLIERIGEPGGPADHHEALQQVFDRLTEHPSRLRAVGHRVVHGGPRFTAPTLVDGEVLRGIRELVPLAPLHNPGALAGIEAARAALPGVPHVAVFDTAFHADLPRAAATYAIDSELAATYGIRRYGFHGISHRYVAGRAAALLGRPIDELHLIVLHLGNGASATAIQGGHSIDTSMGFTPLEGLVMGSRPGDLDPAIVTYLQQVDGLSVSDVDDLLQHRSGLLGLCGANDMRSVLAARASGDRRADLAVDVYCRRIRKYVGAYHALLGRLDAVIFTAGIGEHAPVIRAEALDGLEGWGIVVDPDRNAAGEGARVISTDSSSVAICVVPTDEERAIAEDVAALVPAVA
jgi:acetate kinase